MKQFTPARVAHLREKLARDGRILDVLEAAIAPVRAHYRIPDTARATWSGFYACPTHSVSLAFDIADPLHYRCPVDGEVFTGEPYAGAWWRILNGRNAAACHMAALRYMLLGGAEDLALARQILVDYAARYPGYAVHGDIPYNKPGKANAQTLCDADWIKSLASGYDIVRDALDTGDREHIERDLLHCCAEFLIGHRTNQIHNHECIVSSAVGILGILLEREDYLHFALDTRYGLRDQLAHGVLSDGFWFEGTPSYHYYAMQQFIEFERFAQDAPYSFFKRPGFADILKFPLHILQPDGLLPLLNDAKGERRGAGAEYLHELAFARTGDMDFVRLLASAYADRPRVNVHAFFDGVDELPQAPAPLLRDYHAGQAGSSGLTTMHGPDGRFLLVKHSPFGGEHDHYDRLGLHFLGMGEGIAPDLGTTEYGAPLHYAYYKNTPSHNTVCLDGQNHPPANCAVHAYEQSGGCTVLDARVRWDGSYTPLDSFVIPQWSEEAYAGAAFRRHITWYGDCFVDCFDVRLPSARDIDWTLHVRGEPVPMDTLPCAPAWAQSGPGQYIHDIRRPQAGEGILRTRWRLAGDVRLEIYTCARGAEVFYGLGPDNPSVSDLSYLIERRHADSARFLHVICAFREGSPVLSGVEAVADGLRLVRADGGEIRYAAPAWAEK